MEHPVENSSSPVTPQTPVKGSLFEMMPSKFAFWAGFVAAIALCAVIGLIILGSLVVSGKTVDTKGKNTNTAGANTNTNAAAANTNAAAPTVSGSVDPESLRHVRGDGSLTIVEYSDLECPFCKKFHPTLLQLMEDYSGKVRWSYKHFPLTSLHPKATREALAAECSGEQGKFWEYIDRIYEITPGNNGLEDAKLFEIADELGLDRTQFDDCVESKKYESVVNADSAEAQNLGGQGTPFSVIVDESGKVVGSIPGALPIERVKNIIDSLL